MSFKIIYKDYILIEVCIYLSDGGAVGQIYYYSASMANLCYQLEQTSIQISRPMNPQK